MERRASTRIGNFRLSDIPGYMVDDRQRFYRAVMYPDEAGTGVPTIRELAAESRNLERLKLQAAKYQERVQNRVSTSTLVRMRKMGRDPYSTYVRAFVERRWEQYHPLPGFDRHEPSLSKVLDGVQEVLFLDTVDYERHSDVVICWLETNGAVRIGKLEISAWVADNMKKKVDFTLPMVNQRVPRHPNELIHCSVALDSTYAVVIALNTGSLPLSYVYYMCPSLATMSSMRFSCNVSCMHYNPVKEWLAVASENQLRINDLRGSEVRRLYGRARAVLFSQDGNRIFIASQKGCIHCLSLRTANTGSVFKLPHSYVCSMKLLEREQQLLASDLLGNIFLWDLRTMSKRMSYVGHVNDDHWPLPIFLNQRRDTIGSAGSDSVVRLWNKMTGDHVASFAPNSLATEYADDVPKFVIAEKPTKSMEERGYEVLLSAERNVMDAFLLKAAY